MRIFNYTVIFISTAFVSAYAQKNYITCEKNITNEFAQGRLNSPVIENTDPVFEGQHYEADFLISAKTTCNSEPLKSGIYLAVGKLDSRSQEIKFGSKYEIHLTGSGPMRLFVDDLYNRFSNRFHADTCGLFVDVTFKPSQNTIQEWESEAQLRLKKLNNLVTIYSRKTEALLWLSNFSKSPDATAKSLKEIQNQFISESTESSLVHATAIQFILDNSPAERIDNLYQKYKNRIPADLAAAEISLKKMNFIKSSQAPILASAIEAAKKVN